MGEHNRLAADMIRLSSNRQGPGCRHSLPAALSWESLASSRQAGEGHRGTGQRGSEAGGNMLITNATIANPGQPGEYHENVSVRIHDGQDRRRGARRS